ncbi:neurotrypsin-like [Littorina saxatilis]|uniref:neurotrypsin-like n=1 Tax=Littorina saxatilis TaxID=31220 RepID=UPI0038B679B5
MAMRQKPESEATAYTSAFFQQGYGPVYLAYMNCEGTERSILECPKSKPFLQNSCLHNKDAGVSCIKPVLEDIRLVDGSQSYEGRVELLVNGKWGTICDSNWDDKDARVVCRQLGYDPYRATAYRSATFNAGSGPIYLTDLMCVGRETDILRCPKTYPFKQVNCLHRDDAGVACSSIDNCTTNPCGHYGVCIDNVNGHTCTCNDGTNGLSCQPPGDSTVAWKASVGVLALVLTLCAIVAVFCVVRKRRQSCAPKIFINDDLTKTRAAVASKARQLKVSKSLDDTWCRDGVVFVKKHNTVNRITTMRELEALV